MLDTSTGLIAARLVIQARKAVAGETLIYEVINDGEVWLMFGESYALEHKSPSGWTLANARMVFRSWDRMLRTGDRFTLKARIPGDVEVGDYRLRKKVRPQWQSVTELAGRAATRAQGRDAIELMAEFRVVA